MPAKVTDALAMGIPCLATPTAPLLPLIDEGALLPVGHDDLAPTLEAALGDPSVRAAQARRGREVFLRRFSYGAVRPRLEEVLAKAADAGATTAPADLAAAVSFQRSLFAPATATDVAPAAPPAVAPPAEPAPARPAVASRPRPRPRRSAQGLLDIVMFWRQNDSGIYGRRQDMLVKYLAASPRVRRIVHFDDAVSVPALVTRWRDGRGDDYSQSSIVVKQTMRRARGTRPHPKVSAHTFVYQGGAEEPGGRLRCLVPPRTAYEAWVADVLARNGVGSHPLVFWAYPSHAEFPSFVRRFRPELVVADVVDDTRKWSGEGERGRLGDNYAEILGLSDVVIANCEAVKHSMEEFAAGIHVVPNACEVPSGTPPRLRRPRDLRKLRGPILGYVGNLSSRIDIDLLEHVARARPDWHVVLIGSAHLNRDVVPLGALDNVHLLGVRPYDQIQAYLQAFDVGIVPHLDDEMTRVMNPLKLFVYSAANLPVVSTAVSNIDEMRSLVRVAGDPDEFVRQVEEALREGRSPSLDAERRALLEQHSWPRRVEQVLELVDAGLVAAGAA
jgi:glycosyltransferase involved in cell wall biosynthesis